MVGYETLETLGYSRGVRGCQQMEAARQDSTQSIQ